jgi:ATP-dependent RNA helicase DDX19/DBP5
MGFDSPSKVQWHAIRILAGNSKRSLIAQAPSGSGKTVAFLASLFLRIDRNIQALQGICLTPTLELTLQVFDVAKTMNEEMGVNGAVIAWAANRDSTIIPRGSRVPQILFGTPKGVIAALKRNFFADGSELDVSKVELIVLDEADKLLKPPPKQSAQALAAAAASQAQKSQCYLDDVEWLLGDRRGRGVGHLLPTVTVGFFSASFSDPTLAICRNLRRPISELIKKEVPREIHHFYVVVEDPEMDAVRIIKTYYTADIDTGQAIVFFSEKYKLRDFEAQMQQERLTCQVTCGELSKADRIRVLEDFRQEKFKLLGTTNMLSRGLDVPQVYLVIQIGLTWESPDDAKTGMIGLNYQHRAGRAGRFGRTGVSLSIITESEIDKLHKIEGDLKITIRRLREGEPLPKEAVATPA